jgi:hypothetical protein
VVFLVTSSLLFSAAGTPRALRTRNFQIMVSTKPAAAPLRQERRTVIGVVSPKLAQLGLVIL